MSLISKQKVGEEDFSSGGDDITPGIYGFKVLEAEIKTGKSGVDFINMKLQLYEGKVELCWAWHSLFHNSDAQFCKDNISRFLTITGTDAVDKVEDLVGKCGLVGVKTAEYVNKHGDTKVGTEVQPQMVFRYKDTASASEIDNNGTVGERYKEAKAILEGSELKKVAVDSVGQVVEGVKAQPVETEPDLPF